MFLGMVGFHCSLRLKYCYLKTKSLNENDRYREIRFFSSRFR